MYKHLLTSSALAGALALAFAPLPSQACGEGQFNMGQGLRYQAYLAPRPATVLVYSDDESGTPADKREALITGLRKSGHTVTEVHDQAGLAAALREQQFDVLIASYKNIDKAAADANAAGSTPPRLLPVVERRMRNAPELRERFSAFVLDGASLGQYLKSINSVLPAVLR